MGTDVFTNALLTILILLVGLIGGTGIKKINELIKDVRALLLSDLNNKKDIISLQEDVKEHHQRITVLERKENRKNY